MKLSKMLSWIGQLFFLVFTDISAAKQMVLDALTTGFGDTKSAIEGVNQKVEAEAGKTNEAVTATKNAVDEARNASAEQFNSITGKLDALAATETEDEYRKALESVLPDEVLKNFKW